MHSEPAAAWAAMCHPDVFPIRAVPDHAPSWLQQSVTAFGESVGRRDYPCHFGYRAWRDGELFATWLDSADDIGSLAAALQDFLDATRPYPQARIVFAVFVRPPDEGRSHEWYSDTFWRVLGSLADADERPRPSGYPDTPSDPRWEFCFGGEGMFVFGAAPTHAARLSRQLGPGLVLLFQPRNVFQRIEGGTPAGTAARRKIRARLTEWDSAPAHPSMGDYGDSANFEWLQYFIGDHPRAMESVCPLDTVADERTLVSLFTDQARSTPDAVAIISGDRSMTYAALDAAADTIAGRLVASGIRADQRVGIMADRSIETVVAMLGTLKAGGAYVPVDPAYPEDRRAQLLDDAGVDIVVSSRTNVSAIPLGPRLVLLSGEPYESPATCPRQRIHPDQLAYVIYTSGSTGSPKGVAVSHRQIAHAIQAQYSVSRPWPEAFLMPISFSFDASGVGIYWTLTTGGCVVLPADGEQRDPERLRSLINTFGITHIDCTPGLYDLILGDDPAPVASLQCVQVGGEPCPGQVARRHQSLLPECVLENNYGPTEASIWSTTKVLDGPTTIAATVPIGVPVPGCRIHLLGEDFTEVSPGSEGEIYIGGPGVARGYLGRPAQTAERFLPDPFTGRPGSRMYRSGDIAVEQPDGDLVFLGRADSQVKVRGHRIELGEIETWLRAHPGVADAAVAVREIDGEGTLIGYVMPSKRHSFTNLSLTSFLASRLPEHMVPRRFVRVHGLPRTVSGKIDDDGLSDRMGDLQIRPVPARTGS